MEQSIEKLASNAYYMNPDMVRFLLIENLALKTLLHKANILNPEYFKVCKKEAEEILDQKFKDHMKKWTQVNEDLMGRLLSISPQTEVHPQTKDDAVVASVSSSICQVQPQSAQ